MSVTTTTGKPIGDYEDYHTEDGQPIADVSYFEQDAVIPLSGKYSLSDAKKTTKSVKLSTVIGGGVEVATAGGLEKDANGKLQIKVKTDGGIATDANGAYVAIPVPAYDSEDTAKFLSVKDSEHLVWALPPTTPIQAANGISISSGSYVNIGVDCDSDGGLEALSSGVAIKHTSSDAGKFLTVNSDNGIEWDVVPDGLPSTTGASNGDVLTVNNGAATWAAPSGGGGGSSNVAIFDFRVYNHDKVSVCLDDGRDLAPIISAITSGKVVFARYIQVDDDTHEFKELRGTYPLVSFFYLDGQDPNIFFNNSGSSAGSEGIILRGQYSTTHWEGPWNSWE